MINLEEKSKWLRRLVLEKTISTNGKCHIGSTFSCIELLVALYYGGILRFNPKEPKYIDRDIFVLGKGHVCYALYNILADLGFFKFSFLDEYGKQGGDIGVQLNRNTPGIEYNTGSIGNAIGICAGIALSAKIDNRNIRSVALIGDGECQEGSVWESISFAGTYKLSNLIVIVDRNRLGATEFIEDSGNLRDKVIANNWECVEINGHSFEEILNALDYIGKNKLPYMIIANTVKGRGVSFMENNKKWHNSMLNEEEIKIARFELL